MRAEGVVVTARPLRRRRRRARLDDGEMVQFTVLEEKGIDVRIALDVVRVLLAGACDVVSCVRASSSMASRYSVPCAVVASIMVH